MNPIQKSDLVCHICKLIVDEPVTLPCGCSVCNSHASGVGKSRVIKRGTCDLEHPIPDDGFRTDKKLKGHLESQDYLSEAEKVHKKASDDLIAQIVQSHEEFVSSNENFEVKAHDHFAEVKRSIDLHRENLKQKIDDRACEMDGRASQRGRRSVQAKAQRETRRYSTSECEWSSTKSGSV